jgi:hypothetical protein
MKVVCGICGLEKESSKCEIVVLTPEEKKGFMEKALPFQDRYFYCKPCWGLMSSEKAATLMSNLYESQLYQAGVPKGQAKALAERYRTRLVEIARNNGNTQG